jgi:ferric-dicitrate binding protein FerR (iron transport regulator)
MSLKISARQYSKQNDFATFTIASIKEVWRPLRAGYVALARPAWRLVPMAAGSSASHIACMVAKTPKRRKASNPLASALGAAVLLQWNDLPTPIQRQLFEHAVATGEARHTAQLKEQIARFLHKHKDGERESE